MARRNQPPAQHSRAERAALVTLLNLGALSASMVHARHPYLQSHLRVMDVIFLLCALEDRQLVERWPRNTPCWNWRLTSRGFTRALAIDAGVAR